MAAIEPLPLTVSRAEAAQLVQNLAALADRAGQAIAGKSGIDSARKSDASVSAVDAAEGNRVEEESEGSSGSAEGSVGSGPGEKNAQKERPPATPGLGEKVDIKA